MCAGAAGDPAEGEDRAVLLVEHSSEVKDRRAKRRLLLAAARQVDLCPEGDQRARSALWWSLATHSWATGMLDLAEQFAGNVVAVHWPPDATGRPWLVQQCRAEMLRAQVAEARGDLDAVLGACTHALEVSVSLHADSLIVGAVATLWNVLRKRAFMTDQTTLPSSVVSALTKAHEALRQCSDPLVGRPSRRSRLRSDIVVAGTVRCSVRSVWCSLEPWTPRRPRRSAST